MYARPLARSCLFNYRTRPFHGVRLCALMCTRCLRNSDIYKIGQPNASIRLVKNKCTTKQYEIVILALIFSKQREVDDKIWI